MDVINKVTNRIDKVLPKVKKRAGRPLIPPDVKVLQDLSKGFVETKIAAAMQRTITELINIYKDPKTQSIDVAISSIMLKAAKGDYRSLNFLFDRVIGKVIEKIDMKLPTPFVIRSFDGKEEIQLGMKQLEEGSKP